MKSKLRFTTMMVALIMVLGMTNAIAQFEIGQAAASPTIDGTIDASWESLAMYVGVDPTTWTPNPDLKSLADCSFKWTAVWDADSLYILAIIKDDITTTGSQAEGSAAIQWMNDNVEIAISDPAGSGNTVFFRFGYGRAPEALGQLDGKPTPDGANYATADSDDGWIMEAAIPWANLSSDTVDFSAYPAIDLMLNMNLYVADLDDPEGSSWDQLSGHVQWPWGWGATDVKLVATATVDNEAPAAVTGLASANVTYNSADLSWDASGDADVIGYLVLANDAPKAYVRGATQISLAGLAQETAFNISVIAVDGQNLSSGSSTDFTTGTPPVPLDLDVDYYTGGFATPFEDLDYMDALTAQPFGYHYGDANVDEMDLAANMKVAWTTAGLFMQVNVIDESILNGSENGWENDNCEYHFDMGAERDGSSTEDAFENYDPNNFQYRAIPQSAAQTGSTPAPDWTGVTMATYDNYGDGVDVIGYTLEVSWPWAALNASSGLTLVPADGAKFAFDPKVSDKDEDGSVATVTWSSYTHDEQYKNDAEFGMITLKGGPTGMNDPAFMNGIKLYPNPARNFATISFKSAFTGSVTVIDVTGKVVVTRNLQSVSGEVNLDVSELSRGLYVVSFENESGERNATKLILK
ncbi:MAG: sugar-binding protein [Bacteroidales bacterium]